MWYLRLTSSGSAKNAFALSSASWISSSGMPWSAMMAKPYSSKLRPTFWAKASGSWAASFKETDAMWSAVMVAMPRVLRGNHQPRQRGAHQIGETSGEQRAQAQARDHRPLVGREPAGHRHLDCDRAEVREAAQGKGHDRPAALAQCGGRSMGVAEIDEGDEFVEHHLSPEQSARGARLVPRDADQEHEGREHIADQPLEAEVGKP